MVADFFNVISIRCAYRLRIGGTGVQEILAVCIYRGSQFHAIRLQQEIIRGLAAGRRQLIKENPKGFPWIRSAIQPGLLIGRRSNRQMEVAQLQIVGQG